MSYLHDEEQPKEFQERKNDWWLESVIQANDASRFLRLPPSSFLTLIFSQNTVSRWSFLSFFFSLSASFFFHDEYEFISLMPYATHYARTQTVFFLVHSRQNTSVGRTDARRKAKEKWKILGFPFEWHK